MKYRPEIDGLRAVAVLPVVLSHAGIPGLPGGFLGVDVFFVISGFLITSILCGEFEEQRFSTFAFYARRARRILPALAFMLLLALPAAWIAMLPSQLKDFGQSIVATLGFSANVYFWLTQDYWAQAAELTPLIHLWSLGIEEQFYILFPALLGVLHRRPKLLTTTLAGLTLLSLLAMLFVRSKGFSASAFYLLPFRSWELLAGALAAVLTRPPERSRISIPSLATAALAVIVASYVFLRPSSDPLVLYLPVVVATAAILGVCRSDSPVGHLLAAPALVGIGKLSYSLYLFHQPVLAIARLRFGLESSPLAITLSLALTAVLSGLCYFLVEQPFRHRTTVRARTFALSMTVAAVSLAVFGLSARYTNGFWDLKTTRMSVTGRQSLARLRAASTERKSVWTSLLREASNDFEEGRRRVLFVGDSLSEDLFVVASLAGCGDPFLQFRRIPLDNECIESQARGRTGVGGVPCFEEMRRFRESTLLRQSDCIVVAAAWLETAASLTKLLDLPELAGKCILVFEPHGFIDIKSAIAYMDREVLGPDSATVRSYAFVNRHHRTRQSNSVLHEIAVERGLVVYRGYDAFCDDAAGTCDLFDSAGNPFFIDQAHLTKQGAEHMGASLCDALRRAIARWSGSEGSAVADEQ